MSSIASSVAVACIALAALAAHADEDGAPRVDAAAVDRAKAEFAERMASKHGFDAEEVAATLDGAEIHTRILETISRPAERVVPWHEYRDIFLTEQRIAAGAKFWREHAAKIDAASERYGVAPEILVAIIGVETFFGERMGSYRVLDALATLAFAYPPRASFFASELEHFMLLSRDEGVDLLDALGSYAGAMGAGQFIPSSFRAYAVDANDDGRRDLWRDWEDILASVANYFKVHGWRDAQPVADPAMLSESWSGHEPENSLNLNHTVAALRELGYAFAPERDGDAKATILALEGSDDSSEYWVGYHNFHVITRYNRSVKYALAAHQLSQAILAEYRRAGESLAARSDVP
ncbi:MAG: lytic murein transglycosylase B [Gammaproteobacteria bacterium]|nr:lytic murein transglycosylase B [Gammaproteobacteria bacterium]